MDPTLLPGVHLPFPVQKYFADSQNRAVLSRHLRDLDASEQQDYVDNLAEIITSTESQGADVISAVNKYFELKDSRIENIRRQRDQQKAERLQAITGVASILGLIGLFSLILVLLAIERNTRRPASISQVGAGA